MTATNHDGHKIGNDGHSNDVIVYPVAVMVMVCGRHGIGCNNLGFGIKLFKGFVSFYRFSVGYKEDTKLLPYRRRTHAILLVTSFSLNYSNSQITINKHLLVKFL